MVKKKKKTVKVWNVNIDNIVVSKLIEVKTKYLIRYLDEVILPLVLILPKTSGYVKLDDKNNKLSFRIDDDKLLKKYKTICTKTEGLQNIKLNALLFYDDSYIKTKKRTYGHKPYTNFSGLNAPEVGVKYESFTIISIDSLLVYGNKYRLQVCLDNCACKVVDNQMTDYLDDNLFKTDKD